MPDRAPSAGYFQASHGFPSAVGRSADERIVRALRRSGADFLTYVPCALLAGTIDRWEATRLPSIEATREEEGVGLCAGAALAGRRPVMALQNSGLGNCGNALASLTQYYELPLFLLASFRGGPGERIAAQRPMGRATEGLLRALGVPYAVLDDARDLPRLEALAARAFRRGRTYAVLLRPAVWS